MLCIGFFEDSWEGFPAPQISKSVQLTFQEPRPKGTPVWDNHSFTITRASLRHSRAWQGTVGLLP